MAEVDLQIESILEELRRAEEIDKQNAQIKEEIDEHSESIENLEEETDELAEKIGLDENEKSIIDKNQLKASLSSSEKKRYQNIGKEFIEGAGKEFKNILKASKFKSMMSTVKEKFTAGIKKVKSAIKKVKKASGFLGKLMLIVGLLGAIFYVFKDKIMNAVPNITGFIKDIFEKAKNFIGKFVENAFDFVKGGAKSFLAGGVSGLIGYLKDSLVIFFSRTLPDAIFGLYVNILSMFGNDDAQDL
ncbi:MAG: hypothetical protein J6R59_03000 [Paludibacteraceae bacterium]|nr:hypothetical protein [Paludibacteraceae bacterium]